jgi:hypothetical protein
MKPIAIGINKSLQNQFETINKRVTRYLKVVKEQLAEKDLQVLTSDLLSNPHKSIKQAYIVKHKHELPTFFSENVILDNFEFDFSFIDKNFNPKNYEINSAFKQFGCNDNELIQPDFNYYVTSENQFNLYKECKEICNVLNAFYDNHKGEFTIWLGMIPNGLNNYIETNLSNSPYLQVNCYQITKFNK